MNFQLTEEQSADVHKHMTGHYGLVSYCKMLAVQLVTRMYCEYLDNFQSTFFRRKPLSFDKWSEKVSKGDMLICREGSDTFFFSGHSAVINHKFLDKCDVTITTEEARYLQSMGYAYMCRLGNSRIMEKVQNFSHLLETYGKIPYVMDTEELNFYEDIKTSNLELMQFLSLIGETYDL